MKKILKSLFLFLSTCLAIGAVCMIFVSPLQFYVDSLKNVDPLLIPYNNAYFGGDLVYTIKILFIDTEINLGTLNFNYLPVIGFIMILVGGILSLLMMLKRRKKGLFFLAMCLASIALTIGGGVLTFFVRDGFLAVNEISDWPEFILDTIQITYAPYLSISFACASGALTLISLFIKSKK